MKIHTTSNFPSIVIESTDSLWVRNLSVTVGTVECYLFVRTHEAHRNDPDSAPRGYVFASENLAKVLRDAMTEPCAPVFLERFLGQGFVIREV